MDVSHTFAEKIAGEIVLSPEPGKTIRKWRGVFDVSQTQLAQRLNVSPSVISDYEGGRRKSPGIGTIQKIVQGLMAIDESRGNPIIQKYTSMMSPGEGIIDVMEYPVPVPGKNFVEAIEGEIVVSAGLRDIHGYTLIDSIRAIASLTSSQYVHVYGWCSERALIFTGVTHGRSPMIAVRVHPMKPSLVAYHCPGELDRLAIRLAEYENVPLVVTRLPLDALVEALRSLI